MNPKHWNIPDIVAAVVADDPEAAALAESLPEALRQVQAGRYSVGYASRTAQTRHKTGLSQNKFVAALNISPATLKSWEQGKRQPGGAALALLNLLDKHPELIAELAV